ncbi:hypothetical protein AN2505.2 [Aspergillus nidulans FGSC A4]|uniref:F-box domain protein (AFU_orthologue AFUA_3G14150) n=1 Tax=Emericella nidulans (strain FGSC A4 / ATCC 38163 / CBS 112.46 / NRRL 194 / M139) TaxID=227321 RepID=Q5BAC5_EMENI|nr:protein fbx15 [Aspergillus nidulans FGSC A4]EAA63990.1 hypothetical protein AN2505.2 [Aspergillus nidulans FGSC A4]CBF86989.1 TPA: F-box domain protein (AFU_orthologue; AFUA_3G14150) [Aspergillus nidulans FGSC A4]|eukprot:XP_660109.1 hypothetical protein AN2505.2 [Aspergillus nidulans FGSC A4]
MTRNLDSIPYDVFYQVASKLDCHDFIHLSRVNRALHELTNSDSIARNTVRSDLLHTREGKEADRAKAGYRKAIGRLYDVKESFATAQPYSASILAYGSSFLYAGGSLCYIYNDEIRALDVRGASRVEQVLNLPNVLRRAVPECNPETGMAHISLLNYSNWVVAFLVATPEIPGGWILAVDLQRRSTYGKSGRLRLKVVSLLWDSFGNGDSRDHLYAISTLVDFEEEEVDWTSYYVWICLDPSLKLSKEGIKTHRTWRRQHREGPINDTWSDLSLREDEATGQLMILECRREWRDGGSENCRTYYVQPLPAPADVDKQQPPADYYLKTPLPDEPLTKTLDPSSKPNYEPPRKRLRRHYHSEYDGGVEPKPRRDFILAKTKFRSYNISASSYIDLVNDPLPRSVGGGGLVPRDRIRVRVVSRKRKCPIDEEGLEEKPGLLFKRELSEPDGRLVENSEERFETRGIHLWPPDDAPQELNHLLCPSKRTGQVHAYADDRSIVYSVNQDDRNSTDQAIVLINFDPTLRLPGLKRLNLGRQSDTPEKAEAVGMERPQASDIGQQDRASMHTPIAGKRASQTLPAVREERAMYLEIARGFWLR